MSDKPIFPRTLAGNNMAVFDPIKEGWTLIDSSSEIYTLWEDQKGKRHYLKRGETLYIGSDRDELNNPDAAKGAGNLIDNRVKTQ